MWHCVCKELISKISNNKNLQFDLDKTLILKHNLPLKSLTKYLEPDFSIDPFYSEHYPINLLGGNLIYEIIKKSGSWFSYGDTKLGQGRDAVKTLLTDNPDLMDELEDKIMGTLKAVDE